MRTIAARASWALRPMRPPAGPCCATCSSRRVRDRLGCDDLDWERGRAWAFAQAMGLVWYYVETNPVMSTMGRRTLDRILAAP